MPRTMGLILAALVIALLGSLVILLAGNTVGFYVGGNLVAESAELNVEAGDGIAIEASGDGTQTTYKVAYDPNAYPDRTETSMWGPDSVTATARQWLDTGVTLASIGAYDRLRIKGKGTDDHVDVAVAAINGLVEGTATQAIAADQPLVRRVLVFDAGVTTSERVFMLGRDADSLLIGFDQAITASDPLIDVFGLN